jgi:hypothetical protein
VTRARLCRHRSSVSPSIGTAFITHVHATLDHFGVAGENREAVVSFVESTKGDIVEA